MNQIETNIFEIENLDELNCQYKLYRLKGLDPDSDDYDKNVRFLIDNLSRRTQSPCERVSVNAETLVAQPDGFPELPATFNLVRTTVTIEKIPGLEELNFESLNDLKAKLATRFLQFSLQSPLYNNPNLWQPQTGHPFFNKTPDKNFRNLSNQIDLHRGFSFRVISFANGKLGVCVDTSSKYVSRYYLPAKIIRNDFRQKYKGHRCLYEYGNRWYEIKLYGLNDSNVSQVILPDGNTLHDSIHMNAGKRKSIALNSLPKDCSVLYYVNSRNEKRNVPSALCRLTYGTQDVNVKRFHSQTIKPPHVRRSEIQFVVDKNLRNLLFGGVKIKLSKQPFSIPEKNIPVPDLEYGKNKVLSVRGTPGSIVTPLNLLGRKRKDLIYAEDAGLYIKKKFDRQYLIMPQSVIDTYGSKFIEDLKEEANKIFKHDPEIQYEPIVVPYNDSVQKSAYKIGRQIISALEDMSAKEGYGVVLIPKLYSKHTKKEDILGNLLMRELRERGIFVSIIHTTVSQESYEDISEETEEGNWILVSDSKQQGKYKGYLQNVVLNKILLLNHFWPFVLKTELYITP